MLKYTWFIYFSTHKFRTIKQILQLNATAKVFRAISFGLSGQAVFLWMYQIEVKSNKIYLYSHLKTTAMGQSAAHKNNKQ